MSQNSGRRAWKEEDLQQMLKNIMAGIHASCQTYGDQGGGYIDYVKGANIAGSRRLPIPCWPLASSEATRGWLTAWFDE